MQQILNRLVSLEEQQVVSSSQRKESSGRAAVEVAKSAVPVATISAETFLPLSLPCRCRRRCSWAKL
ncbi:hypothetical protein RR46_05217 [Papilio xuthus]|uniref:Uncharacterized protein n=1 Tax=Papilio xuthus TaxID=66420 RepID=A0A194Q5Z0_PAPXU|nr:hypothetical protein RR46_05217 [Papilio xuthus]